MWVGGVGLLGCFELGYECGARRCIGLVAGVFLDSARLVLLADSAVLLACPPVSSCIHTNDQQSQTQVANVTSSVLLYILLLILIFSIGGESWCGLTRRGSETRLCVLGDTACCYLP